MVVAPPREDEARSIEALRALDVLDTAAEPAFDAIVRAASLVCGTPISLLTLIDSNRQWFKANHGLDAVAETPRDLAFCAHAVLEDHLFEVGDATRDERFADNPLVTEDPAIRFYAGIPLTLRDGNRIGTLCVIDRVPRQLTEVQKTILTNLGEAAAHALEGRRAMLALEAAVLETTRSEALLSQERRRLANVIDGANVGVWDLNLHTGEAKANARLAEIGGTSLDALGPLSVSTWFDALHPDDVDRARTLFEQHISGASPRYESEARIRRADGSWCWIIDRGRVMTRRADGSAEWVVGARLDIDERKQREELIRRSQDFLDRTGKAAGVGGWQVDLATNRISWSEETFRIYGIPVGREPPMEKALDFFPPEARAVLQSAVDKAIATGEGWELEVPFVRADGEKLWVRSVGSPEREEGRLVRIVGAFQDITARVEEHLELKRANARVQVATDSGAIGIWEYDLVDQTIIWDAWMYRIYGLPPGDRVITMKVWQPLVPEASFQVIRSAVAAAARGERDVNIEFAICWPDGSARTVRCAARALRDEGGRAIRLIGTTWDVTEAKLIAAELERQSLIATVQASVAVAANQATSLTQALSTCVDLVCTHTGWPVGHVYLRSPDHVDQWVASAVWSQSCSEGYDAFKEQTSTTVFSIGRDIVARAAVERLPVIFDDLQDAAFMRARSASATGLQRGVAAPVVVGEEVVAVLEFYTKETRGFDPAFIDLVAYTGTQIGRVVDRERARASLERQTADLREQSIVDELTGLYNRRGFLALSAERLATARGTPQRIFLLFADLDGMKRINDELGHDVGDAALVATTGVLRRTLRAADVVARLGGDEFVALICDNGSFESTSLIARLEAEVARTNTGAGLAFDLAVSFGITGPAGADEDLSALLKRADAAMYEQKIARKSR